LVERSKNEMVSLAMVDTVRARKSALGGYLGLSFLHPLKVKERVDTIKSNPIK